MIKLLGILDILAGICLWASALIPVPGIILGFFGIYLLFKGLVFVGFGLDFLSLIDIIFGFIILFSISIIIHPIIISLIAIYLVLKGSLSLA